MARELAISIIHHRQSVPLYIVFLFAQVLFLSVSVFVFFVSVSGLHTLTLSEPVRFNAEAIRVRRSRLRSGYDFI